MKFPGMNRHEFQPLMWVQQIKCKQVIPLLPTVGAMTFSGVAACRDGLQTRGAALAPAVTTEQHAVLPHQLIKSKVSIYQNGEKKGVGSCDPAIRSHTSACTLTCTSVSTWSAAVQPPHFLPRCPPGHLTGITGVTEELVQHAIKQAAEIRSLRLV